MDCGRKRILGRRESIYKYYEAAAEMAVTWKAW